MRRLLTLGGLVRETDGRRYLLPVTNPPMSPDATAFPLSPEDGPATSPPPQADPD